MKKSTIGILFIGLIVVVAVVVAISMSRSSSSGTGGSSSQAQTSDSDAVETNLVDIKDFTFTPAHIKVKKGLTVTWTNRDSTQHNVVPDSPTAEFKASELLSKDQGYSVTFNTVGTFTYHCSPHPSMKATVEVVE